MIKLFKIIIDQFKENIGASVILLMSLAWNDVVQSTITKYFPLEKNTLRAKIIYAIIITILIIILKIYLNKDKKSEPDDMEEGCGCEGFNY